MLYSMVVDHIINAVVVVVVDNTVCDGRVYILSVRG